MVKQWSNSVAQLQVRGAKGGRLGGVGHLAARAYELGASAPTAACAAEWVVRYWSKIGQIVVKYWSNGGRRAAEAARVRRLRPDGGVLGQPGGQILAKYWSNTGQI